MTFDEWFEQNRDKLIEQLRNDVEEALYDAYFAGYEHGLDTMGQFTQELWNVK